MTKYIAEFLEALKKKASAIDVRTSLRLSGYTTFKIGGDADIAVFPKSKDELITAITVAQELDLPFYVVGRGSNLLADDDGFRGVVIFTTGLDKVTFNGTQLYAEAGVNLTALSRMATERSLTGLEFACGIPGTVGGAVYMNAGAYGSEMKNVTVSTDFYSLSKGFGTLEGEAQGFDYRRSAYMDSDKIVIGANVSLALGDKDEIARQCNELLARRREKQPLEYPSAGSAFKRCPDRFTAQMLDEAGLKGFGVGDAQVSEKHAGFIVNKGRATSKDVIELVKKVKAIIYEREGLILEPEFRYLSPKGEEKL